MKKLTVADYIFLGAMIVYPFLFIAKAIVCGWI